MKKRLLFILEYYPPHIGGVEILFEDITQKLSQQGYEITVLTTRSQPDSAKYEKKSQNLEVYRTGSNRFNFLRFGLWKGIKLSKKTDIIHSTTFTAAVPASIIGKLRRKPTIITVHEVYGKIWYRLKGFKGFFYIMFEKLIFLLGANKYICVSNYTLNSLRVCYGIKDKKLARIYNGIDTKFWQKKNIDKQKVKEIEKDLGLQNNFVGLFYGHPGPQKGSHHLIEALPKIVKNHPEFHLLMIITDGEHGNKLIKKAYKLGVGKHITPINGGMEKEKLLNYIALADTVFLPSITEGFCLAAAEISALGKKSIVSYAGAIPEVISGKVIFIKPGSRYEIENAVEKIQEKKREEIPTKQFSIEKTVEEIEKIYTNN